MAVATTSQFSVSVNGESQDAWASKVVFEQFYDDAWNVTLHMFQSEETMRIVDGWFAGDDVSLEVTDSALGIKYTGIGSAYSRITGGVPDEVSCVGICFHGRKGTLKVARLQ